jgi:hypothetical protein
MLKNKVILGCLPRAMIVEFHRNFQESVLLVAGANHRGVREVQKVYDFSLR